MLSALQYDQVKSLGRILSVAKKLFATTGTGLGSRAKRVIILPWPVAQLIGASFCPPKTVDSLLVWAQTQVVGSILGLSFTLSLFHSLSLHCLSLPLSL